MYIMRSHLVDLVVYLLGEPRRITSFSRHSGLDGIDFADNILAVLEYDKALARIYASSVEVNGWGRRQLMISGSRGTINIMPLENKITMTRSDIGKAVDCYEDIKDNIAVGDVPKDCRYDTMMRDFHDYVTGAEVNPFTYEHDYTVQKVLLEITASISATPRNSRLTP